MCIRDSYTADTLYEFKRNYKNLNFSIIMGEDNLVGLENWKNYNKILESKIYVYPRENQKTKNYKLKNHKSVVFSDAPFMRISSSEIRDLIKNNYDISHLVPDQIFEYISKNGLYR